MIITIQTWVGSIGREIGHIVLIIQALIERTGKETGDGTNVLPLLFCVGLGFVSMSCLQT